MTSTPLTLSRTKRAILAAPLLALIAFFLSSCGGGGGGDNSAGDAAASGYTLTGVVAVGAPLVGAKVEAWCGDGTQAASAVTDAKGRYEMKMPADCQAPLLLQASEDKPDGIKLFSYLEQLAAQVFQPDQTVALNMTTLTDLFTKMTLSESRQDVKALLEQLRKLEADPAFRELVAQKQQETVMKIKEWLPSVAETFTALTLLQQPFNAQPGDPMDDALEAFAALRGSVPMEALVEQAESRGGDLAGGQPWKTLFGEGTALTLSATDCVAWGAPADPATATLRMQDKNLEVTLASSLFAAPETFTVGPAASSDFQMILNGDSPLVRLRASAGGNALDLFTLEGAPMVALSAAGTGVTCTLSNPVRRADLVAFHPAARIRSVIPASGASGDCAASAAGAAYGYAVSRLGDVRFDGTSLSPDWLDAEHAYYSESLQYGMGGPGPSYQVQLAALPTGQGIQGYYFSTVPYGMNCTAYNP